MIYEALLRYGSVNQPVAYCQWEDGHGLDVGYVQELTEGEVTFATIDPQGQSDGSRTLPLASVYRIESVPDYIERLKLFGQLEPPISEAKGQFTRSRKVTEKRLREAAVTGECVSLNLKGGSGDDFRIVRIDEDNCEMEEYGDQPLILRSVIVARITQIDKMIWRSKAEDCVSRVWRAHQDFPIAPATTASLLINTLLKYKASQVPVCLYHSENAESFKVGIVTELSEEQITFLEIDQNGRSEGNAVLPFGTLFRVESMPRYIERLSHFAKIDPPIADHKGETTTSQTIIQRRLREATTTGECVTLLLNADDGSDFRILRVDNEACEAQVFAQDLFKPISTIITRLGQIQKLRRRSAEEDRVTTVWQNYQRQPIPLRPDTRYPIPDTRYPIPDTRN